MRIKQADDKSKRVRLLESLLSDTRVSADGQKWLNDELWALRMGVQGEEDAAHYLDAYFHSNAKNTVLLHDLRIEVDGQVAQIDHLLINRVFEFILIESKNFRGNLIVNERGEFSVDYSHKTVGIPSPFEQSKRHALVLDALRKKLGIAGRLGTNPKFTHVVLMHPKTTITRPEKWGEANCYLMKADAFATWYQQEHLEEAGLLTITKEMMNVRTRETVQEWGQLLLKQHRPADLFHVPEFARPKPEQKTSLVPQIQTQATTAAVQAKASEVPRPAICVATGAKTQESHYFCAKCKQSITKTVFSFCMNNKSRFLGRAYCMKHQKEF